MTRGKYGERARSVREARVVAERAEKERRAAVAETKRLLEVDAENARLREQLAQALEDARSGSSEGMRLMEESLKEGLETIEATRNNLAMFIQVVHERQRSAIRAIEQDREIGLSRRQVRQVTELMLRALNAWKSDEPALAKAARDVANLDPREMVRVSARKARRAVERANRPTRHFTRKVGAVSIGGPKAARDEEIADP